MVKKALPMMHESSEKKGESNDPQMCRSYVSDMDPRRRPLPDYIEKVQTDVTPNMRGILVDWLVEVAEEYKLLHDTLFLSVYYINNFLSKRALNRKKL
ncbi:hypothetical protein UlMin_000488 [Ulmus minor]